MVTNENADGSEVLLSKGKEWVGSFGAINNFTLASGNSVNVGGIELKGVWKGTATLRKSSVAFPQLLPCEDAMKTSFGVNLRALPMALARLRGN